MVVMASCLKAEKKRIKKQMMVSVSKAQPRQVIWGEVGE